MRCTVLAFAVAAALFAAACGDKEAQVVTGPTDGSAASSSGGASSGSPAPSGIAQPVYTVVFTHIEDNTPAGTLGTPGSRTQYLNLRARLIEMAELARRYNVKWSLQPDWKYLLAAQQYEDAAATASTGGVNLFRYLRDSLGVNIDPHSHENGGYNYADVAHLLTQLGVGGSAVIGGHIWDPTIPQFQNWERFRAPLTGSMYPTAVWRGEILMGSGSPNHVNDPIVSGVWHPRDRNHYFEDDPAGNVLAVGAFHDDLAGIQELRALSTAGTIASSCMMTASIGVPPATLTSGGGLSSIESSVVSPLAALVGSGQAISMDFTALVSTWRSQFGGRGCLYNPEGR